MLGLWWRGKGVIGWAAECLALNELCVLQQVVSFLRPILFISRERVALDDPKQVLLVLTFFGTVNEPPISLL